MSNVRFFAKKGKICEKLAKFISRKLIRLKKLYSLADAEDGVVFFLTGVVVLVVVGASVTTAFVVP